MSYITFARRYRPKIFDEIVGQDHITTTLKNAVLQDRVSHAYLFTGPRGVGKTTTARILAKAINCPQGPSPDPCNNCPSCNEITQGMSLDVLEIDGASNRGIDEIRNLRDNIKFAPAKGKFKVYIIDEVHMLTQEAFNALLKILEEPPPHAKFVFATTQAYKVPPTILSRCQRFDFRRISNKDIFANLKSIAANERLSVKDEALRLIARCADGSMRDGQVILDQIISFKETDVGAEDVLKVLGLIDEEILFGLSDSIKNRDAAGALTMIGKLVDEGKDVFQVVLGLIEHFRNILIIKTSRTLSSLADIPDDKTARFEETAKGFTVEEVLYVIYTLSNTIDFMRKSNLARIPLEAAMVKLANMSSIVSLHEIMKKIDTLSESPVKGVSVRPVEPQSVKPKEMSTRGLSDIAGLWNDVINQIRNKKISIASFLQEGYPVKLEEGMLSIGLPREAQFHKEVLESVENKRLIEDTLKAVVAADIRVVFILVEPGALPDRPVSEYPEGGGYADDVLTRSNIDKDKVDPIIKEALNIFSGEITGKGEGKGKGSR